MLNRRDFLKQLSILVAGAIVAPDLLLAASKQRSAAPKRIGLQLYSLNKLEKQLGIGKVLEIVSKIGFTDLESASYSDGKIYGLKPSDFKKMVDDAGLRCSSAHVNKSYDNQTDDQIMTWWDRAIDAHREAQFEYIIQPSIPRKPLTEEHFKRHADYFNTVGRRVAEQGVKFGYHNHDFEFTKVGDRTLFDTLLEHTDSRYVTFELDTYWAQRGGSDPLELMKRYKSRIDLVHVKDEKELGGADSIMDYEPIFKQIYANGIERYYVEIERYSFEPQDSVKCCFDYLSRASFVK